MPDSERVPTDDILESSRMSFLNSLSHFGGSAADLLQCYDKVFTAHVLDKHLSNLPAWSTLKENITKLQKEVERFRDHAQSRPTACLMGKISSGKTTLLKRWLGDNATDADDQKGGLKEISLLPIGHTDTTACLTRLTCARDDHDAYDPDYMTVHVLTDDNLETDTVRDLEKPTRPSFNVIRIASTPTDGMEASATYNVCRYPKVDGSDAKVRLSKNDEQNPPHSWTVGSSGDLSMEDLQWWAREVIIPCSVAGEDSNARRTIRSVDVVDAPGADGSFEGQYPDWKAEKNAIAFRAMMNRLDMLLIVAHISPAAANFGTQMQTAIWKPWQNRCGDQPRDRAVCCFTASGFLFKMVSDREDNGQSNNSGDNVKDLLYGHVVGQLVRDAGSDLETLPPMLFFENEPADLAPFCKGIAAGSARRNSDLLIRALDGGSLPGDLAEGLQCVYRIAKDWEAPGDDYKEKTRKIQQWVVKSLCCLLDPDDRGYGLLTRLLIEITSRGLIAQTHADERMESARLIHSHVVAFRKRLFKGHDPSVLEDCRTAAEFARKVWERYPRGPMLRAGDDNDNTSELIQQVRLNRLATLDEATPIFIDHVIKSICTDAIASVQRDVETPYDLATLVHSYMEFLRFDDFTIKIRDANGERLDKEEPKITGLIPVILARLVRVMESLANAEASDLESFVLERFAIDSEIAELVANANRPEVKEKFDAMCNGFAEVDSQHTLLVESLKAGDQQAAYLRDWSAFLDTGSDTAGTGDHR